jgi:hypothetical protein
VVPLNFSFLAALGVSVKGAMVIAQASSMKVLAELGLFASVGALIGFPCQP